MDYDNILPSRVKNSKTTHIISIDPSVPCAEFLSSDKESQYHTTLEACECVSYFVNRDTPCKHMVRLAMELGILDSNGFTPKSKVMHDLSEIRTKLTFAFANYYLFDEPSISDKEYDKLKRSYILLLEKAKKFE